MMIILFAIVTLVFIIFTLLFLLFILFQFMAVFTTNAPFVPVPDHTIEKIIQNLNLNGSSILYDLGCGDAKILVAAAKGYPQIKAIGIESALVPFFLAKFKSIKYENIEIWRENFFQANISPATHIFMYLYQEVSDKLMTRIIKECKKGTIIASCDFKLSNIEPDRTININPSQTQKRGNWLYIYVL